MEDVYIINSDEINNGQMILWIEINGVLKKISNISLSRKPGKRSFEITGSQNEEEAPEQKSVKKNNQQMTLRCKDLQSDGMIKRRV